MPTPCETRSVDRNIQTAPHQNTCTNTHHTHSIYVHRKWIWALESSVRGYRSSHAILQLRVRGVVHLRIHICFFYGIPRVIFWPRSLSAQTACARELSRRVSYFDAVLFDAMAIITAGPGDCLGVFGRSFLSLCVYNTSTGPASSE